MPVPPVLPFTTTYAVTAEILVGWDTPPKITHPFAPTNGSLDASISGVKFTTVETRKDANKALISTDTYYSTRARPIAGEFVYTIKDASVTTATFGHVWRRDKNTNIEKSRAMSLHIYGPNYNNAESRIYTPGSDNIETHHGMKMEDVETILP